MKRKIVYILMLCMTISLFTACGKKPEGNRSEEAQSGALAETEIGQESEPEMLPESEFETEQESEPETLPENESETVQESEPETLPENESEIATESEPSKDVTEIEETKQEDLPVGEEIEEAELFEDMKAVFDSVLDFMVPEEEMDAASGVSNAILAQTDITINSVEGDVCNITVRYPNAAQALIDADAKLAADASEEEVNAMLNELAQAIANGEVEMVEKTLDITVIEVGEFRTIEWTKELYDAITGGLYSIE